METGPGRSLFKEDSKDGFHGCLCAFGVVLCAYVSVDYSQDILMYIFPNRYMQFIEYLLWFTHFQHSTTSGVFLTSKIWIVKKELKACLVIWICFILDNSIIYSTNLIAQNYRLSKIFFGQTFLICWFDLFL